jgi:hypothetical protein
LLQGLPSEVPPSSPYTFFLVATAGLTPEHRDAQFEPLSTFKSIPNLWQDWNKVQTAPDQGHLARLVSIKPYINDRAQELSEACNLEMDFRPNPCEDRYPKRYIASLQRLMNRRLFYHLIESSRSRISKHDGWRQDRDFVWWKCTICIKISL